MRSIWAGEPPFDGADPVGPPPVQPGGPPLVAGVMGPKGAGPGGPVGGRCRRRRLGRRRGRTRRRRHLRADPGGVAGGGSRHRPPHLGQPLVRARPGAEDRLRRYASTTCASSARASRGPWPPGRPATPPRPSATRSDARAARVRRAVPRPDDRRRRRARPHPRRPRPVRGAFMRGLVRATPTSDRAGSSTRWRAPGRENLDPDHVARYDDKEDADADAEVELLPSLGLDDESTLVDLGAGTGQLALAAAATVCPCRRGRRVAGDAATAPCEGRRRRSWLNLEVVEAGFLTYEHAGRARRLRRTRAAPSTTSPTSGRSIALDRIARDAPTRRDRCASRTSCTRSSPSRPRTGSRRGARPAGATRGRRVGPSRHRGARPGRALDLHVAPRADDRAQRLPHRRRPSTPPMASRPSTPRTRGLSGRCPRTSGRPAHEAADEGVEHEVDLGPAAGGSDARAM